ncbi:SAVMC3_10250 family protein [Amycolatopsis sp. DSM 110486]|nr:SAVMC3_10250 family protein [Amycolatopsis sp. DSM 110486]
MLLPQIDPGFAAKRKSEVGVKLSVLSLKKTAEHGGNDRVGRLERVLRHLEEHGDIGSVDEPGQFFWGLLPVQWGRFPGADSMVFAGGRLDDTVVALGGSGRHIFGAVPNVDPGPAYSHLPPMLDGLASDLEDELLVEAAEQPSADPLDRADRAALTTVRQAVDRLTGPAQNVEFVAKRLLHGTLDGVPVLLGSPVYIALID